MGAGGNDVIHQSALQQVNDVGTRAAHLPHRGAGHHLAVEIAGGLGSAVNFVAVIVQLPRQFGGLLLVAVLDSDNDAGAGAGLLELVARRHKALHHGLMEGGGNAQHLAGGLHFGAEHGVHAVQLEEAVHRHLHRRVGALSAPPQAGAVAHILQFFAQRAAHRQIHHGHAGDLGNVGHRAGGTGVDLDDVDLPVLHRVLHVDKAHHFEFPGKAASVIHQRVNDLLGEVVGRVDADGVAGMDAGALHLFHDAGHQIIGAVTDGVHLTFGAVDVLVHQHRMAHVHVGGDDAHVLHHISGIVGHDHVLATQHIGGAHQNGIAHLLGGLQRLVQRVDGAALRAGDAAALQQFIEALPILRLVDGVRRGAQNGQTDLIHVVGQLDGGLTAELHKAGVRLFGGNDLIHALRVQRVKIQSVAGVKVGGNGFRVVVDKDGLAAMLFQRPDSMY